jgi:hypothetical protein
MIRKTFVGIVAAAAAFGALAVSAFADDNPTYFGPLSPAEKAFVSGIQADLNARFPTAADAEKAGYVRYTSEDETGAISYANMKWTSDDAKNPSQLWYDANGKLLGADFSQPKGPSRPTLWGINPGRWYEFDTHMHYVTKDAATGAYTYDSWVPTAAFIAAGGSAANPTADTLVKMGKVKAASDVTTVFLFPSVWDLIVWVKPNPNGAFAEKNPLVHPTATK